MKIIVGEMYYKPGSYFIPINRENDGYYLGFICGKLSGNWEWDTVVHKAADYEGELILMDMTKPNFIFSQAYLNIHSLIKQLFDGNIRGLK